MALIVNGNFVEHYEMAAYGTSRAIAESLELPNIAELLQQTLDEEYDADEALNTLALSSINLTAEVGA